MAAAGRVSLGVIFTEVGLIVDTSAGPGAACGSSYYNTTTYPREREKARGGAPDLLGGGGKEKRG
jgi:hypothetical protein